MICYHLAQVGHEVQVAALQVAPVFGTVWPNHACSLTERVRIGTSTATSCKVIIYIAARIIHSQKWSTLTFCVLCEVRVVAYVDFVVLEELIFI